jgi:hypothetical protein
MKLSFIFISLLLFITREISPEDKNERKCIITDSTQTMNFSYIRDTLYTRKQFFIDLNLETQMGYLHSRSGEIKEFGISSGTDKLEAGINTKAGLFVIQSKLPQWYSRQFDSTLMLNWMGFNYGTGLHALKSSGYYRYLGKKRSSHGCIRVSRDVAKMLFDSIEIGTPVLVHKGNSAVAIAFADSVKQFVLYNYKELYKKLLYNFKLMYAGNFLITKKEYISIDNSNIKHDGLPIGNSKNILKRQIIKSPSLFVSSVIPQPKNLMIIDNRLLFHKFNKL